MKKNRTKLISRAAAVVLGAALLCGTAVAASTITSRTITAQYMGIQIVVDGVAVTPKDANGNVVEPFVSEGTTYLPVRAIGEALGKEVTWDGETRTVYVGQVPGTEVNWMTELPPYQVNSASKVYDGTDTKSTFTVVGETKTSGITLEDPDFSTSFDGGYAIWNTNALYTSMTFTAAHLTKSSHYDYDGVLDVYLDGELAASYDLAWDGAPQTITVPLNRAASVRMELHGFNDNGSNERTAFAIYDISFAE